MTLLTSWPVALLLGALVAVALFWWQRSAPIAALAGLAVAGALVYAVPQLSRSRTIAAIERAEQDVRAVRAELEAAKGEAGRLRARVEEYAKTKRALLGKIATLEARDREHVRRRAELDQVVIPPLMSVHGPDETLAGLQRYGTAWRAIQCAP